MALNRTMGPPPVPSRKTGNAAVDSQLERTNNGILDSVRKLPGVQGTVLYGLTLKANVATTIDHKLGTKPRSWQVCGVRDVFANFCQVGEADNRQIVIKASADVTFDLRIW